MPQNHSCLPNCLYAACYINETDKDKPLIAIFARIDIAAGEEVTICYRGNVDDTIIAPVEKVRRGSSPLSPTGLTRRCAEESRRGRRGYLWCLSVWRGGLRGHDDRRAAAAAAAAVASKGRQCMAIAVFLCLSCFFSLQKGVRTACRQGACITGIYTYCTL